MDLDRSYNRFHIRKTDYGKTNRTLNFRSHSLQKRDHKFHLLLPDIPSPL